MAEENKLIQAAMGGNTAAFEQIVKTYQSLVCAITFSGTGRVDVSEELAQETFLRAWKNLRQLKEPSGFRAWLCAIARNIVSNYYRGKKTLPLDPADLDGLSDSSVDPANNLIAREELVMLERALMLIPADYREPLVLFYRQGKSTKEAAAALGLKESTVRMRLHRARQMLREEMAARLERTLEQTAPGRTFTKTVMLAVGGAAVGISATANAAGSHAAATGVSAGMGAFMNTLTAKVITAASVTALAVGSVLVWTQRTESAQPQQIARAAETAAAVPVAVEKTEIVLSEPAPIQEGIAEIAEAAEPQSTAAQAKHTDPSQAVAPEPVVCMHAVLKEDDRECEVWIKGSEKWRIKSRDTEKICDGKRVLVLDHRNREAAFGREGLKQPEDVYQAFMIAETVFRNYDPSREEIKVNMAGKNCIVRKTSDIESGPGEAVCNIFEPGSDELLGTAWVDEKRARLNRLWTPDSQGGLAGEWNYDVIDDKMFSTQVPVEFALEQGRWISGIVTDAELNPVTDATVYVTGSFEGPDQKLITRTNKEGFFECPLKFAKDDWGIKFPVVIRAVSPSYPDMAAWSCILDPDTEVREWPDWMPPVDPEVMVTKLQVQNNKALCKSIQALWLPLGPAGSVGGMVTDKGGEPIPNAVVDAYMYIWLQVNNQPTGRVFTNGFIISDTTDENGCYKITGIPSLQGKTYSDGSASKSCSVSASASGYSRYSQYVQNTNGSGNMNVTFLGDMKCDFVLSRNGLTLKGRVVDNYGNPLAHYDGVLYQERGDATLHRSGRLDGEGRFVIHNAPKADVILIRKETRNDSHTWQNDSLTKNLKFIAYPEKEFECHIPPDVNEFDVGDLVMDYPEITAEIYVVDYEGHPVGFVECAFEQIGNKELLKDRYWKVTNEAGKCVITNVPRAESTGGAFRPISLRPSEKAPAPHREKLGRYPKLTYYHLKYPGAYKHYVFELVLPRDDHRQDYRMRIYSPEGELLLEQS